MKQILKIRNGELSFRLKLNYNNVHSRLRMLLGNKASLFADISTKSTGITWYADDDAEYNNFADAPKAMQKPLSTALAKAVNAVRKELAQSKELAAYADDILEIPDYSFVFYRTDGNGYKFVLAGWGCKYAHQNTADPNSGFIKHVSRTADTPTETKRKATVKSTPENDNPINYNPVHNTANEGLQEPKVNTKEQPSEDVHTTDHTTAQQETSQRQESSAANNKNKPEAVINGEKKMQSVTLRVFDQNNNVVPGEEVSLHYAGNTKKLFTSDNGIVYLGELAYGDTFGVSFPNIQGNHERTFEVEPNVETYDAYVKKFVKFAPVIFVEDQHGNAIFNYNVKIIVNGIDTVYNSGTDGVIQLPMMIEGQKFIVIDTANYANTEEYVVTSTDAKKPYHFLVKTAEKSMVGITILNKAGKPMPNTLVCLDLGDTPCQKTTGEDGRAEFPYNIFTEGDIPMDLRVKGNNPIKLNLHFTPDATEYTVQLKATDKKKPLPGLKWLALLPLLLLLAWGGYKLLNGFSWGTPTMKEMEKGVVLIQANALYYVETGFTNEDGEPQRVFLKFDKDENINGVTFDPSEKGVVLGHTGTGFLISKDGLIATNRHVADPLPPEGAEKLVKQAFLNTKEQLELKNDTLSDILRRLGTLSLINDEAKMQYDNISKQQKQLHERIQAFDKLLTLGDFKVKVECQTSVAFVNSIIETWDDFIGCSLRISGEPGGVRENDLAIIQLKNKERDIPKDAFIFNVPQKDLMDNDIPEDYDITVLGYNAGIQLADIKNGIHPQPQRGKVTMKNEKYRIGYNASTLGGSSGAPVLNKKGQLVAINNSGLVNTQGYNFGVRTKYLYDLLQEVLGNTNNNKNERQ